MLSTKQEILVKATSNIIHTLELVPSLRGNAERLTDLFCLSEEFRFSSFALRGLPMPEDLRSVTLESSQEEILGRTQQCLRDTVDNYRAIPASLLESYDMIVLESLSAASEEALQTIRKSAAPVV